MRTLRNEDHDPLLALGTAAPSSSLAILSSWSRSAKCSQCGNTTLRNRNRGLGGVDRVCVSAVLGVYLVRIYRRVSQDFKGRLGVVNRAVLE